MNRIEIKGIIPPIITPMHADESINTAELRRQVSEVRGKIKALGNVNVSAIEEYAEVSQRKRRACAVLLWHQRRGIYSGRQGKTARAGDGH